MIGGSLFYDFARVGATPALFQSFVLSAGVVTDYVYGAGMHWQAMFPMIAVQRYLGEASAGTRLDDQRQPGHIPRGWALLLHLWCGSTLCRSRGHTIFASALADSRMGAPTRRRSHSLHCNGRECLEHPPRIGALPPLAACPLRSKSGQTSRITSHVSEVPKRKSPALSKRQKFAVD